MQRRILSNGFINMTKSIQNIGLSLSGGGVRAAVFHLGVLARLAETPYWNCLKHISTVSGGSLCVALIFEKAGKQWPDVQTYLNKCLPECYEVMTRCSLQNQFLLHSVVPVWRLIQGRAKVLSKRLTKLWGIEGCVSDLPASPRWTINTTCFETGKNWRFSKKRMGDYVSNYVMYPEFQLADAVAASAAVPGLIGPLKFKSQKYRWEKYISKFETTDVAPVSKFFSIWDGGVYDNLGVEALYKTEKGLRYDLDFCIVSDASKPVKLIKRRWLFGKFIAPNVTRLNDIATDQVRSLRARELFSFFKKNNSGTYIKMGESVGSILKQAGSQESADVIDQSMTFEEVCEVAAFPTCLKKVSLKDFISLFKHGYETCSANLSGVRLAQFKTFDKNDFSWLN